MRLFSATSAVAVILLFASSDLSAGPCDVRRDQPWTDLFEPIQIVAPVAAVGQYGNPDGVVAPEFAFSVPFDTTELTFNYTYCQESENSWRTSGDTVRWVAAPPIYIIEPGRTVTGNHVSIGPQPGDLFRPQVSSVMLDDFQATDTAIFDVSSLAPGDYVVQVLQNYPWLDVATGEFHPDGDQVSYEWTAAIMTIVPEPSTQGGLVVCMILQVAWARRRGGRQSFPLRCGRRDLGIDSVSK